MSDRSALLALAARAEAGGDAALSRDVWIMLGWREKKAHNGWIPPERPQQVRDLVWGPRPNLQTSLDAQAELPGRIRSVMNCAPASPGSWIAWAATSANAEGLPASAPTESLARLGALLRALAAAKEDGDGE